MQLWRWSHLTQGLPERLPILCGSSLGSDTCGSWGSQGWGSAQGRYHTGCSQPLCGTVNPLNGLGGNSSSPLLNGSSDAACRALEVAELRPYSGPNHPPTPSQNNNNPSDILAGGGTEAAFVPGPSGDPPPLQQQCPFVRPARCTGTGRGRFCQCLFSLKKLEGVEGGRRKPAGRFMFTSSTWRHLVFAPQLGARTMRACAAPERGVRGGGWRHPGENVDSYGLEEPGGKQGLDLFWFLAVLSSIFCLRLLKLSVRSVSHGSKRSAAL